MQTDIEGLVLELGAKMRHQQWRMATAESCTGGLIASTLTNVSGSSEWFEGAVVAYDNRVKTRILQVPENVLVQHGAVSQPCVECMVQGVCSLLDVPVGVAVSGIAGPGGGSVEKPVGMVWMAWHMADRLWSRCFQFQGSRLEIKAQSMRMAVLELVKA